MPLMVRRTRAGGFAKTGRSAEDDNGQGKASLLEAIFAVAALRS
jgi:hypothetical protein